MDKYAIVQSGKTVTYQEKEYAAGDIVPLVREKDFDYSTMEYILVPELGKYATTAFFQAVNYDDVISSAADSLVITAMAPVNPADGHFYNEYIVEVSMRWQGRRESDNVEDRRNSSGGPSMGGPGFRLPSGKGGLILLIVVLVAGYYGVDLTGLMTGQPVSQQQSTRSISPNEDEAAKFTSVILATTEDTWGQQFEKMGKTYQQPKLVMYRGMTRTGCGAGQSIMGPFYCPADGTVYIDLSFYDDMKDKLGADGDFAQGYVIAHEVGHHVQKLLGIEPKVRQLQQNATQAEVNRLSVRMELQADCFAGVWGHSMQQQGVLETGDLEEALNAAQAIGDDRLQQQSQGRVVPDSFTHGTSQQRYSWFKRGFDSGDPAQCNTFGKSI